MGITLFLAMAVTAAAAGADPTFPVGEIFEAQTDLTPHNKIDELVFARLKQLKIEPARPVSDSVFLRRVYLDVIGTLPTIDEVQKFLRDSQPDKRSRLIDELLVRREFADYWTLRWCDLLRVKAEFPINLWPNAVQTYHRWIYTSIKENKPYDRFARELLTESGSNFRVAPVNFYRAMQSKEPPSIARTVALTFMGTRAEAWPKERLEGMAAFFAKLAYKGTLEWKEEIVMFDPEKAPGEGVAAKPVFPDGTSAEIAADRDPREAFADWLITPENPWFTRAIVNRVWWWLLGRGIVHEPDDFRPDNPPSNPELLDWLAGELPKAHYDLKHVFRLILNSRTYQLSWVPRERTAAAAANFAYYQPRRLEAEVLIDALCQITGTTEKYSSIIPEPFTFIPENQRTITLADGSITSAFLEMFGRPPRDTGVELERNNRPSPEQRLHLLNSSHIQQKIEAGPKLQALLRSSSLPSEVIKRLYLTILSRYPTDKETDIVAAYSQSGVAKNQAVLIDVAWALFNSPEFLYRH